MTRETTPECDGKCQSQEGPCPTCHLPYVTDGTEEVRRAEHWDICRFVARKLGKGLLGGPGRREGFFEGEKFFLILKSSET